MTSEAIMPTCENCFFYRSTAGTEGVTRDCRRFPPRLQSFLGMGDNGPICRDVLSALQVPNDYWCGEHKPVQR